MIKAQLERADGGFCLEISGHADYAPVGEDLVCAAVSALAYGLCGLGEGLEREGLLLHSRNELSPGRARICLCPKAQAGERTAGAFALAAEVLARLGEHFPENIHFTEKRRNTNDY